MNREDVYKSIDTERLYQDIETGNTNRKNMVLNFDISKGILAIERTMIHAREKWYKDNPENNYQTVMNLLRKVAGICVKMGETYGMPERNLPTKQIIDENE